MNINVSLWDNKHRMRERIRQMAQIVMSLTAMNAFIMFKDNWFIFGLNVFFFTTMIPVFISYSKWRKEPPKDES